MTAGITEAGDKRPKTGPVRLAGPPEFTSTCVLPALSKLVSRGLNLRVTLGRPAERLLDGLTKGTFDVVVSTTMPGGEHRSATVLFKEEFVLVAGPGVAAEIDRDRLQREPAELSAVPLIAYDEDLPIVRRYWREVYGTRPVGRPAVVVADLRAVLAMTVAGAGATVLPLYLCRQEIADGRLTALIEPPHAPSNDLYLVTEHGAQDAGVQAVVRCLQEHAPSW